MSKPSLIEIDGGDPPMRVGGSAAKPALSDRLAERCQWLKRKTEFHFRGLTPDERCDLRGLTLELREMADDAYELEHQPLHLLELKGTRDAGA